MESILLLNIAQYYQCIIVIKIAHVFQCWLRSRSCGERYLKSGPMSGEDTLLKKMEANLKTDFKT